MPTIVRLPSTPCPICKEPLDSVTSLEQAVQPKDGDATVCMYCNSVLVFTNAEKNTVRLATKEDLKGVDFVELKQRQNAITRIHKQNS